MKYSLLGMLVLSSIVLAGCNNTPNTTTNDSELTDTLKWVVQEIQEVNEATTPKPTANMQVYAMSDVEAHGSEASCRTVIRGNVYDVTAWINQHPGGDRNILKTCGIDATAAFERKHGGQEKPENILAGFEIGTVQ